jgi:hypothetical protein
MSRKENFRFLPISAFLPFFLLSADQHQQNGKKQVFETEYPPKALK